MGVKTKEKAGEAELPEQMVSAVVFSPRRSILTEISTRRERELKLILHICTSSLPVLQGTSERTGGVLTDVTGTAPHSVFSVLGTIAVDASHPSSRDAFYQHARYSPSFVSVMQIY